MLHHARGNCNRTGLCSCAFLLRMHANVGLGIEEQRSPGVLSETLAETPKPLRTSQSCCPFILLQLRLRPERPFTGVSGPSGPKIAKKSQKESFGGPQKKSPKIPEQVKKYPNFDFFGYFLTSGIFGDFFADPPKDSF